MMLRLQRVAACCSVLQRDLAECDSSFYDAQVAVCCSVLQRLAVCCSVLQRVAAYSTVCFAGCVAVWCSVLLSVAVCCRVLQSVLKISSFTKIHPHTRTFPIAFARTPTHPPMRVCLYVCACMFVMYVCTY